MTVGGTRDCHSRPVNGRHAREPALGKETTFKAGERIRTADVQLGKHNFCGCRNRQKSFVFSTLTQITIFAN